MARRPIPSYFYALVVVRRGDQFLLVDERSHGGGWYLPAGRVEEGEDLLTAARRETLEESGIPVVLDGILRIEHSPLPDMTRCRVFFLGHPADDRPPKSVPDDESLGARWFTIDELRGEKLRGDEVLAVLRHVALGGPTYPLSLITPEGAPWH
jgi:phosphatase NudJ